MKTNKTIAIVGVGLIGGSIGLALKSGTGKYRLIGIGRRYSSLRQAKDMGVVDEVTIDLKKGIKEANLVILATPVATIIQQIKLIAEFVQPGQIITDVGSTKSEIVREAEKVLGNKAFFVGAHPLAGSEQKGVAMARPDIFKGTVCIVTPTARTDFQALKTVSNLWKNLGAIVRLLTPLDHDRITARVSHLPHVVSVALCQTLISQHLDFVSSGFRDTTRIAMSDANLWTDICFSNRKEICKSLELFIKKIQKIENYLASGKRADFNEFWQEAADLRKRCDG